MSDEQQAPVEQSVDVSQMQAELEAMRRKNADLLREYKTAVEQAKAVPDGLDIQELIDFKRKAEQTELESQGKHLAPHGYTLISSYCLVPIPISSP